MKINKGGHNEFPSQISKRPPAPGAIDRNMDEAAARIEALEAALKQIALRPHTLEEQTNIALAALARAALDKDAGK